MLMPFLIIRNERFAIGTQQDSHEALRQIFDELREEEIKVSTQLRVFKLAYIENEYLGYLFKCHSFSKVVCYRKVWLLSVYA